ncbi:MAG: flagellar M-ring protein FliF [Bryobacteraceae bacterium]|nr:flagellar basal-body MS-ring/collar protein FliF [Bryobacterales bacterium]NUN00229.1 flagellar M-ring protein FliF [Bryobacteraceae bacterium]
MDQLKNLFLSLSMRQRITTVIVALAVITALFGAAKWNRERDFKLLYSGLSSEDAGAVLAKLKEGSIEYRLEENGSTVLVPSAKIAELRLQMAAAGLPKTGRIGFELFDQTNFGLTEFAEQVNYHRALEGELERSLISLSEVEHARVHITLPKDSLFVESRQPAKASVMLKLRFGSKLSAQNIAGICHLLASAVEGLSPEMVSVLDVRGNLLNRPRPANPDAAESSEASLEYRQRIERDLITKINTTLEPLLGPDRFRAGVFVDCDFTSGEQSEETFDPSRSVMVTSQRTEDAAGTSGTSGTPGVASNLPRPSFRPGSSAGGMSRRTENITYQSSRTVRHIKLPQGGIKRVSVSLLVDQDVRWEGSGPSAKRVLEPPPPEKLKVIRDLVAAAVGFTPDRGDQLIVESLPFETTANWEPLQPDSPHTAQPGTLQLPAWLQKIAGQTNGAVLIGAGAGVVLVLLALALFLFRRSRNRNRARKLVEMTKEVASGPEQKSIEGDSRDDASMNLEAALAQRAALQQKMNDEALSSLKIQPVSTKKTEVLARHIGDGAKKDPTSMAHVVRTWLNDERTSR